MENIIIGIIIIIIVILAVRGSLKHFRGESSCCGGGSASVKPKKKQLKGEIIKSYLISIDGMHCQNCANSVERAINGIEGAAAKVSLKKHEAKVRCDREIDFELIRKAVEVNGYGIKSYVEVD